MGVVTERRESGCGPMRGEREGVWSHERRGSGCGPMREGEWVWSHEGGERGCGPTRGGGVGVVTEREGERELMREEELSYTATYHTDKIDKESEK